MKNGLSAALSVVPDIPAPFDFESTAAHPVHHSSRLQIELDSYRIALVPFHDVPGAADRNSWRESGNVQALVLPLTWRELVTRVRDQAYDPAPVATDEAAHFGEVHINFISMEVHRCGCQVKLTSLEFKVLKYFVSNPNRVVTRDQLLEQAWGYQSYPCTRTVDNLVLKLRRKLEPEHTHPVHFQTVHGTGYKFMP